MRGKSLYISPFIFFLAQSSAFSQILIQEVRIEGNQRLKEPAVIAATGVSAKTTVARADLDAGAQKLFDTGLFTGVNYSYAPRGKDPAAGYTVTFIVTEEAAKTNIVLDIPGVDSQQLWTQLAATAGLVDRVIPASQAANAYYTRQIEAVLARLGHPMRLATQDENDLSTKVAALVFQPADRPAITDIAFQGNVAVPSQLLRERIAKLTLGNQFSEREFRLILEANLRPLYEEKGLLSVAFREIRSTATPDGKVSVNTIIDDGRVWKLGKVGVEGDDLPIDKMLAAGKFSTGRVANWKEFLGNVENMKVVLKRDGYLGVSADPVRKFQAETGDVDVTLKVRKGKQYRFATIDIAGISESERRQALALWKLEAGQPMDEPYFNEYLKAIVKTVNSPKHTVSPELKLRPGTDQIDAVITFK